MTNRKKEMKENEKHVVEDYPLFYKILDSIWNKLPGSSGTVLATAVIFLLGSTMRGDWLLILVHFMKFLRINEVVSSDPNESTLQFNLPEFPTLKSIGLEGLFYYVAMNTVFSLILFFGICGFLEWWFYIRQRDHSETWKCQPNKWIDPELEKHEKKVGARNVVLGSFVFGAIACHIDNGGYTTLYDRWDEYGWTYLFLSIPLHFLYQDAAAYYYHRLLHTKWLYINFHKEHHLYKQPTPYSVSALAAPEMLGFQFFMVLPVFVFPVHSMIYFANMLYIYYYGIMAHSGIDIKSIWPWQPRVMFHDNHHQYFHVNYGFNLTIWDKLHGTYRRKDAYYDEKTFGGKGKELDKATADEIQEYKTELNNEIKTT